MDDDMAGGPTRTSRLCRGERRPSRHGVNSSHQTETKTSHQTEPAWGEHISQNELSANDVLDEPTAKTPHALPAAN